MTPRHRSPWRRRLLALAVGLLLVGRAAASDDGPTPAPLACLAGAVTWLVGTAPPGTALLVRFADATVGGGSAGSAGHWRIPLTVEAPAGIYPVVVVERQGRSLVGAFTCYVGVPVGATPTGTPTRRPVEHLTATSPSATVTPQPSIVFPTPATPAVATAGATTTIPAPATPGDPTPTETRIPAPPTATVATATPTSTVAPTGEMSVALVAAQADDPNDRELYEYVILENQSPHPQALLGWKLTHQATGEAYSFPDLTMLAGEQLVVWSGVGADDPTTGTLFWPATTGRWVPGQTAQLVAPDGRVVHTLVVPSTEPSAAGSTASRSLMTTNPTHGGPDTMRRFLLARSRFACVARILSTLPRMKGVTAPNNLPRATLAVQYNAAVRQKVGRRVDQGRCVRFAEVHAVLTVANLYDDVASHRDGA